MEEVPFHPIRAQEVHQLVAVVMEIVHAAVLKKSSHDGTNLNVIRQATDSGTQCACAPYDEVDFHPLPGMQHRALE